MNFLKWSGLNENSAVAKSTLGGYIDRVILPKLMVMTVKMALHASLVVLALLVAPLKSENKSNVELQLSVAKLIAQQSEWIEHKKVQDQLSTDLASKLLQQDHTIQILQDKVKLLEKAKPEMSKSERSGREVNDRMPESCEDLWKIGHTLNGFFNVKNGGAMQSVYCDFSKSPGDEGLQTLIGTMDVKTSQVYFHVQRNSTFSTDGSNVTIPFNVEVVNIGNAMNLSDGTFTTPTTGTYFFAFNGVKVNYGTFYVSLFRNDRQVATAASYGFRSQSELTSVSLISTLKLEVDDFVYLVGSGSYLLEEPGQRYTQFTGILLIPLYCEATSYEPGSYDCQSAINEVIKQLKTQEKLVNDLSKTLLEKENAIEQLQGDFSILISRVQQLESDQEEDRTVNPKATIFRTCDEIRRNEPSSPSGTYSIDPDGDGSGDPPITVYCNMSTGATVVSHDSENITEVDKCAEPGCYSRPISYNGTQRQITALVGQSRFCQQSIRFDCLGVPLEFNSIPQAWWNDARGLPQYYWAGSNTGVHTCQCGLDRTCVDSSLNCNCDSVAYYELFDYGLITEKSALPVTKLNFGRTIAPSTYGRHTLGKLECSGREVDSRMPESCEDLWKIGHTLNGFFSVKGSRQMQSVYCDFSKIPGDEGLQTLIGSVDVKSTPVYFHVQRNSTFSSTRNATITFDTEVINEGDAMDVQSGIFTAPKAGTYFFAFSGSKYEQSQFYVSINLNNQDVASATSYGGSYSYSPYSVSLVSTLNLEEGDEVCLSANGGYLLEEPGNRRFTQFTGILLQEELF